MFENFWPIVLDACMKCQDKLLFLTTYTQVSDMFSSFLTTLLRRWEKILCLTCEKWHRDKAYFSILFLLTPFYVSRKPRFLVVTLASHIHARWWEDVWDKKQHKKIQKPRRKLERKGTEKRLYRKGSVLRCWRTCTHIESLEHHDAWAFSQQDNSLPFSIARGNVGHRNAAR